MSQIVFNIDAKLKEKAMRRARKAGVPFSSVLKFATAAYAEGRLDVGMAEPERFNAKTRKEIEEALEDSKCGRNLSPVFRSAKEMDDYLDKL
ncbi:hypothetical protein BK004_02885 [bacterium CG10_46_32]|nr:MAG: hypothetical protein BK004_02885 [bacterium CG10_46_32]PIR56046.1 MAG: hypothetical protein COU73_02915 [Parcubacteria group bacterium CG10_big_fil_rev_8_21_14_0_10_46_32]